MGNSDLDLGSKYLGYAEKVLYVAVGLGLVVMSALVAFQGLKDFYELNFSLSLTLQMALVLNDVLFIIILLELLSTVVTHISEGGFQLKPFLIIGIISSVRRILVLGAQLSTASVSRPYFNRDLSELALDAVVALILTLALTLVRKSDTKTT